MSAPDDSDSAEPADSSDSTEPAEPPEPPQRKPTHDLLLAHALDACIAAERQLPGSSEEIIARQPVWARRELQRLVGLALSLDAATSNAFMSDDFRVQARARLMHRIGGDQAPGRASTAAGWSATVPQARAYGQPPFARPAVGSPQLVRAVPPPAPRAGAPKRRSPWLFRVAAGLLAAALGLVATLSASANALPGEPLYSVKQAQEDLEIRLATDDQARSLALLRVADVRLAETTRLLQLGRTDQVAETTQSYDEVVERATFSYGDTATESRPETPATQHLESALSQEQDQLKALLQAAPVQAQPDLRAALMATERGRALVDSRPVEQPQESPQMAVAGPTSSAQLPVTAAENQPTPTPTLAAATAGPAVAAVTATDEPSMPVLIAQRTQPDGAGEVGSDAGGQVAVIAETDAAPSDRGSTASTSGSESSAASAGQDRAVGGPAGGGPAVVPAAAPGDAQASGTDGGEAVVHAVVDAGRHTADAGQATGGDHTDPVLQVNTRGSVSPLFGADVHAGPLPGQADSTGSSNAVVSQPVTAHPVGQLGIEPAPAAAGAAADGSRRSVAAYAGGSPARAVAPASVALADPAPGGGSHAGGAQQVKAASAPPAVTIRAPVTALAPSPPVTAHPDTATRTVAGAAGAGGTNKNNGGGSGSGSGGKNTNTGSGSSSGGGGNNNNKNNSGSGSGSGSGNGGGNTGGAGGQSSRSTRAQAQVPRATVPKRAQAAGVGRR